MNPDFTDAEKSALAVTEKLTELMMARNLDGMNHILDENFTLTHITGYVQPKKEWLQEVQSESMKYYGFEPVSRKVTVSGNRAEVIQQNRLDALIWGSRNVWNLQQIIQLEKREGKWMIMKSVGSTF